MVFHPINKFLRQYSTQFPPKYKTGSLTFILLFSVALMSYWVFLNPRFFEDFIGSIVSMLSFSEMRPGRWSLTKNVGLPAYLTKTFIDAGSTIFLISTVIGSLHMLSEKELEETKFSYLVASLCVFFFAYGYVIVGSFEAHLPGRWKVFSVIFLILPSVVGISFLRHNKLWKHGKILSFLFLFSICTSFLLSADIERYNPSQYLERAELFAADKITSIQSTYIYGISSDFNLLLYLRYGSPVQRKINDFSEAITTWNATYIRSSFRNEFVAVRKRLIEEGIVERTYPRKTFGYTGYYEEMRIPLDILFDRLGFNRIIDNGAVSTVHHAES